MSEFLLSLPLLHGHGPHSHPLVFFLEDRLFLNMSLVPPTSRCQEASKEGSPDGAHLWYQTAMAQSGASPSSWMHTHRLHTCTSLGLGHLEALLLFPFESICWVQFNIWEDVHNPDKMGPKLQPQLQIKSYSKKPHLSRVLENFNIEQNLLGGGEECQRSPIHSS